MRSAGSAALCLPRYQLCQLQEVGLIIFRKELARSYPSLLPLAAAVSGRASGKQSRENVAFGGYFLAFPWVTSLRHAPSKQRHGNAELRWCGELSRM